MKDQAASALSKNDFYRGTYPKVLKLLVYLTISAFFLLMLIGYYVIFLHKAQYFMVQQNNQYLTPALDYPIVSRSEILRWSSQAVISVYNFDFSNWEVRIKETTPLFTSNGFDRFQDALKLDGVLGGIVEQKLQVTAVVTGPPVITAEGIIGGRYSWKVNLPVLLTYISSSEVRQRSIYVTMVIARISVLDSPRGYAIEQFYEESA